MGLVSRIHRRVRRRADGCETSLPDPHDPARLLDDILSKLLDEGRDLDCLETHVHQDININEYREQALEESTRFLEANYRDKFGPARIQSWWVRVAPMRNPLSTSAPTLR